MRAHKVKIWPEQFRAVKDGRLTAQIRRADRDYQRGDFIMLLEFDAGHDKYTGANCCVEITDVQPADAPPRGMLDGHVLLSVSLATHLETQHLLGQGPLMLPRVDWLRPK